MKHGAVENAHQLASTFLWFHKADEAEDEGLDPDPRVTCAKFHAFLVAKGVGDDDTHRRIIVLAVLKKLENCWLAAPPPDVY
jgi:hypothetical protein